MAVFYNQASLSYNGGTANSNIVSGEILEALSVTKTAVNDEYSTGDTVTYAVSITNTGTLPVRDLTLTDNLGEYTSGVITVTPLTIIENSVLYYQNGVLQPTPTVTAGPPAVISGITVPASGNAIVIYSVRVNEGASPELDGSVTNTVTVTGNGVTTPLTADETINARQAPILTITKDLTPRTVTDNSVVTYTLTIRNYGNTPALAEDNIVITDNFDPVLSNITVSLNGNTLDEGTGYTYNEATGTFATVAGVVSVPAAEFAQNTETGEWTVVPGVAVVTVVGNI